MGQLKEILSAVQNGALNRGLAYTESQVQLLRAMGKSLRGMVLGIVLIAEEFFQFQHDLASITEQHILKVWQVRKWITEKDVFDSEGNNLTALYLGARKEHFQAKYKKNRALENGAHPQGQYIADLTLRARQAKRYCLQYMLEAFEAITHTKLVHVPQAGWFWCHGEGWEENLSKLQALIIVRAFLDTLGSVQGQRSFTRTALDPDDVDTISEPEESGITSDEREVKQTWRRAKEDMSAFDIRAWAQREADGPFPALLPSDGYAGESSYDCEFGYGVSGKEMNRVLKDVIRSPSPKKGEEDELIDFTFCELWTKELRKPVVTKIFGNGGAAIYEDLRAIMSRDVKVGSPTHVWASQCVGGNGFPRTKEDGSPVWSDLWPGKDWWKEVGSVGHSGDARPNARRSGNVLNVFKPKAKQIKADWASIVSDRFLDPSGFWDWMLYVAYKLAADENIGLDVPATLAHQKGQAGVNAVSNRSYVMLDEYGEIWVRYVLKTVQPFGSPKPYQEAWMVMPVGPLKQHFSFKNPAIQFVAVKLGQVATIKATEWLDGYKRITSAAVETLQAPAKTKKARKILQTLKRSLKVRASVIRELEGIPEKEVFIAPAEKRCFTLHDLQVVSGRVWAQKPKFDV